MSKPAAIDMPFDAWIDYCALKTDASTANYSGCIIPEQVAAHSFCPSTEHRLTLTRR